MEPTTLLNARDIAARLNVSLRKLNQMIDENELPPYVRIGRHRKWRSTDIDEWIDRLFAADKVAQPSDD